MRLRLRDRWGDYRCENDTSPESVLN